MPYFALIIMFYHVKIACYQLSFIIYHFFSISTIDLSSDLINFEENIRNFLISLWIRPLFTIIPLTSNYFHQIGKFEIIFDTRPCEIDDLAVSSRHETTWIVYSLNLLIEKSSRLDFMFIEHLQPRLCQGFWEKLLLEL